MDEDTKKIEVKIYEQIDNEIKEIQSKLKDGKLSQPEIEELETKLELKLLKKFSYETTMKILHLFEEIMPTQDATIDSIEKISEILAEQTGKNNELEKLLKELKENRTIIQKNYSLIHGLKLDTSIFKSALGLGSED